MNNISNIFNIRWKEKPAQYMELGSLPAKLCTEKIQFRSTMESQ